MKTIAKTETKVAQLSKDFNEVIETLITKIESGEVTEEVKAWVVQCGKFPMYSLSNQMLIWRQNPDATRVAGYSVWRKLGRNVTKGQKGIGIIAPHTFQTKNADCEAGRGVGFHRANVFDVDQTEGEPLLNITHINRGEGGPLYSSMVEYAESIGMPVREDKTGVDGSCSRTEIVINPTLSMSDRVHVLAHELAHHLLGHIDKATPTDIGEYQADTTAFVVCEKYGIENKSPQYLKEWGATRAQLKKALGDISKVSGQIIEAIEKHSAGSSGGA